MMSYTHLILPGGGKYKSFIADVNDDAIKVKYKGEFTTVRKAFLDDPILVLNSYGIIIAPEAEAEIKDIQKILKNISNIEKSPSEISSVLSDLRTSKTIGPEPTDDLLIS